MLGSDWLVEAAVTFAKALGVSDLVIGADHRRRRHLAARGGHLIVAAISGERDIAVGNVVGSNIFNILGCLGAVGAGPATWAWRVPPSVLAFDIWVMMAVAVACLPVFLTGREIARWEGGVFLGYYVA